jgi:hypothetical protein
MWEARFFPDARINLAENLLDGRGIEAHQPALLYKREELQPGPLTSRRRSLHFSRRLRSEPPSPRPRPTSG